MPIEIPHSSAGFGDMAIVEHHASVPTTPHHGSTAATHSAFQNANAAHAEHEPGAIVPLEAAHLRMIDPLHVVALLMHMFGMSGEHAQAGLKNVADHAARDARALDEHVGEHHGELISLPAPDSGGAEHGHGDDSLAIVPFGHHGAEAPAEHAHVDDSLAMVPFGHHGAEAPAGHAPTGHGHAHGGHAHAGHTNAAHTPAAHASAPHISEEAAEHTPSESGSHEHAASESGSHVSAHAPNTEDALEQQASSMKQMIEYQAKLTEMNMMFKIQSDMLQSVQKMTNDAADASKYQ